MYQIFDRHEKVFGSVIDGPYKGQKYEETSTSRFPRWRRVVLTDDNGRRAERDIPERLLNQ